MSLSDELAKLLVDRGYEPDLRRSEPLAPHTSLGIGGPADLLVVVRTADALAECVRLARQLGAPTLVVGGGSNILVADEGIRGLAVINACIGHEIDDTGLMTVRSGNPLSQIAEWSAANGWQGLEWAAGIPGTIGGAIVGNAGAYGGCLADIVQAIQVLTLDGQVAKIPVCDLEYGYRTSALKAIPWHSRPVVLSAELQFRPGSAEELVARATQIVATRRSRIPEGKSAGSMFKRTLQFPAGFLIEQAGLKGSRVGGAEVSVKHANFLLNSGNATAKDMKALVRLVQQGVWSKFAQRLEPEVEMIGDEGLRPAGPANRVEETR